MLYPASLVFQ